MHGELSLSRDEIDALADEIADTAAHIDAAIHRLLTTQDGTGSAWTTRCASTR